jgi:uncharacterized protein
MKLGSATWRALILGSLGLAACASQPDRFYTLSAMPPAPSGGRPPITTQIFLGVSLPAVTDRREMVLGAPGDEVVILEHERWAAPLSDLVGQTLGLDIERRRPDVLVAERSDRASGMLKIRVDIVQLSAHMGGTATLEAHWRVIEEGSKGEEVGAETFSAPVAGADYTAVARAISEMLSSLADRLAVKLPPG